jgi:hypothetical protein
VTPVPELAIIDGEVWQAAQLRLEAGRRVVTERVVPFGAAPETSTNNVGARLAAASSSLAVVRAGAVRSVQRTDERDGEQWSARVRQSR